MPRTTSSNLRMPSATMSLSNEVLARNVFEVAALVVSHHIKTSEDAPNTEFTTSIQLEMYNIWIRIWLRTYVYTYIHMIYICMCTHSQNTNSAKFQISSEHSTDCPVAFQDSRTQSTLDTIFWCYQAWHIDQCTPELKLPRSMLLVCLQNNGKNPSTSAKVARDAIHSKSRHLCKQHGNRLLYPRPNMKQPSMSSKESALRLVFLALFGCVLCQCVGFQSGWLVFFKT